MTGPNSPVTYEITAIVPDELHAQYEEYMRGHHIPDLLATGAFTEASLSRSAAGRYRIRYEARDRGALDQYLANDAPRFRQRFMSTFRGEIELVREEWLVLERWHPR